MGKSRKSRRAKPTFQQRYASWNQNPRVQLTAAIASFCAGIILIVTGVAGPGSTRSPGGTVLIGFLFLGWGGLCLSIALRTFRAEQRKER